jgi:hypothetical protein
MLAVSVFENVVGDRLVLVPSLGLVFDIYVGHGSTPKRDALTASPILQVCPKTPQQGQTVAVHFLLKSGLDNLSKQECT